MPHYSHHMVGVGGIVESATGMLLAVRERSHGVEVWKLPGGYAELGEDLKDAVIREVLEETSVRTEFVSMVSLRSVYCV
jgi:ADP-ribose pyrophosphatase YjhB (NUDIX family)